MFAQRVSGDRGRSSRRCRAAPESGLDFYADLIHPLPFCDQQLMYSCGQLSDFCCVGSAGNGNNQCAVIQPHHATRMTHGKLQSLCDQSLYQVELFRGFQQPAPAGVMFQPICGRFTFASIAARSSVFFVKQSHYFEQVRN